MKTWIILREWWIYRKMGTRRKWTRIRLKSPSAWLAPSFWRRCCRSLARRASISRRAKRLFSRRPTWSKGWTWSLRSAGLRRRSRSSPKFRKLSSFHWRSRLTRTKWSFRSSSCRRGLRSLAKSSGTTSSLTSNRELLLMTSTAWSASWTKWRGPKLEATTKDCDPQACTCRAKAAEKPADLPNRPWTRASHVSPLCWTFTPIRTHSMSIWISLLTLIFVNA